MKYIVSSAQRDILLMLRLDGIPLDHINRGTSLYTYSSNMRHTVAQLVEVLRYKAEGYGFDSRWCHWNFSLT